LYPHGGFYSCEKRASTLWVHRNLNVWGTMKHSSKFNAAMALGSLTAAVALLAGAPAANAQQAPAGMDTSVAGQTAAPGGGSFPGSFLVPGTNTSLKVGGFAKLAVIYDTSSPGSSSPDVVAPGGIPLRNTAAGQFHNTWRLQAKQSNFAFDVRTPTSYGELDIFILTDFFGQNVSNTFNGSNTQNARLVLAYGSLGPLLGGQALSLWFDGDALGETVDPTTAVGITNGLTNRQPQLRYTFVAGGGLSFAGSMEQPDFEGIDNGGCNINASNASITPCVGGGVVAAGGAGAAAQRYPDFVAKGRFDQAWGHVALAGLLRNQDVVEAGVPRYSKVGWGVNVTGHLNTFGKDTLRGGGMVGEALGHYLSDMGQVAGLETNTLVLSQGAKAPISYGVNASYTHWWTDQLRSTVMGGYSHINVDTGVITTAAVQNALDKDHIGTTVNLIWSPVPQVDLGIEYDRIVRITTAPNAGVESRGNLNRIEAMTVFKF